MSSAPMATPGKLTKPSSITAPATSPALRSCLDQLPLTLLLPPALTVEAIAAAALAAGFTGHLIYARIVASEASCGCVGSSAKTRWLSSDRPRTVAGGNSSGGDHG
ncbi:MauE/DoxX family redox-associated membrane protein [Kribbella sp. NPDC026596]|uniref:MauE/DoxX family redox-associated membrane protein n=1 Tax=Kribbella sp. NPDC026596 TaxID=3155122 RepID=UPI0033D0B2C8